MSDPGESKRKIIESWQQAPMDSGVVPGHGLQDLMVGGALLGIVSGAVILARFGADNGSAPLLAMVGAVAGAAGCSLLGLTVALVGQWLAERLGIQRFSRQGVGARIRYSGLVGLLGGPFIQILLRGFGIGIGGVISALLFGALLWMLCGIAGGAVGVVIDRWRR